MRRDSTAESPALSYPRIDISRFLLPSFNIGIALLGSTLHWRRQKLSPMANGLSLRDACRVAIGRIRVQGRGKSKLCVAALMWTCQSGLPLQAVSSATH